jgi:hypothetical protein
MLSSRSWAGAGQELGRSWAEAAAKPDQGGAGCSGSCALWRGASDGIFLEAAWKLHLSMGAAAAVPANAAHGGARLAGPRMRGAGQKLSSHLQASRQIPGIYHAHIMPGSCGAAGRRPCPVMQRGRGGSGRQLARQTDRQNRQARAAQQSCVARWMSTPRPPCPAPSRGGAGSRQTNNTPDKPTDKTDRRGGLHSKLRCTLAVYVPPPPCPLERGRERPPRPTQAASGVFGTHTYTHARTPKRTT